MTVTSCVKKVHDSYLFKSSLNIIWIEILAFKNTHIQVLDFYTRTNNEIQMIIFILS